MLSVSIKTPNVASITETISFVLNNSALNKKEIMLTKNGFEAERGTEIDKSPICMLL